MGKRTKNDDLGENTENKIILNPYSQAKSHKSGFYRVVQKIAEKRQILRFKRKFAIFL